MYDSRTGHTHLEGEVDAKHLIPLFVHILQIYEPNDQPGVCVIFQVDSQSSILLLVDA